MECVSPAHGRILIYVWAIEQDELSKRIIPAAEPMTTREAPLNSSSGSHEKSQGQDVFVPWVRAGYTDSNSEGTSPNGPQVFNRYYHMFATNEILVLVHDACEILFPRHSHLHQTHDGHASADFVHAESPRHDRFARQLSQPRFACSRNQQ